MDLQRLIYLCHLKNELNRRRRRFYYYMREQSAKWDSSSQTWHKNKSPKKHISYKQASIGYSKAQEDMKAMTYEMRQMRLDMGVRFIWNWSGHISAIEVNSSKQRIPMSKFNKFYESELFEIALFTKE